LGGDDGFLVGDDTFYALARYEVITSGQKASQ